VRLNMSTAGRYRLALKMCKHDAGAEVTADLLEAKIGRQCVVTCELLLAANVELQNRHWYDSCFEYAAEFRKTVSKPDTRNMLQGHIDSDACCMLDF
jgi:hypothetical protein